VGTPTGDVVIDFTSIANTNPYAPAGFTKIDTGALEIVGGTLKPVTSPGLTRWVYNGPMNPTATVISAVEVGVANVNDDIYAPILSPTDGHGYALRINNTSFNIVTVAANGTIGGLDSGSAPSISLGDVVALKWNPANGLLSAIQNGTALFSVTDTTYTSGLAFGLGFDPENENASTLLGFGGTGISSGAAFAAAPSDTTAATAALTTSPGGGPVRVARIVVSCPTASSDGLFHCRYPQGNAFSGAVLAGAPVAATAAAGGLTTGSRFAATASVASSATAALTTGAGGAGPTAVANLTLVSQTQNAQKFTWGAATPGSGGAIASYNIYRSHNGGASGLTGNGLSLLTTVSSSTLTYTDSTATNSVSNGNEGNGSGIGQAPSDIYTYTVTAVDVSANEGPQANMTAWMWYGEANFIGADFLGNNGGQTMSVDYTSADTSDVGPYDIAFTSNGGSVFTNFASGTPPYANGYPGNQTIPGPASSGGGCPLWALELGAFKYMVIDLMPSVAGVVMYHNIISRGPPGDIYNNCGVFFPQSGQGWGPNPMVPGVWNTYKIPISELGGINSQQLGICTFQGYISGNTLTVTSAPSGGAGVQPPMFLTVSGLAANTYVSSQSSGTNGGIGTYVISGSATIGSAGSPVTIVGQRTNFYKGNMGAYSLNGNQSFGENVTVLYNRWGFTQS
jgi:hypothetical protein